MGRDGEETDAIQDFLHVVVTEVSTSVISLFALPRWISVLTPVPNPPVIH